MGAEPWRSLVCAVMVAACGSPSTGTPAPDASEPGDGIDAADGVSDAGADDGGIDAGAPVCPTTPPPACPNGVSDAPWGRANYVDEELDPAELLGFGVDRTGAAHMVYFGGPAGDLRYATNGGGVWRVELVPGRATTYASLAMALDGCARVHLAYREGSPGRIWYVTNASGLWTRSEVPARVTPSDEVAIAIDAAGTAHIAYAVDAMPGGTDPDGIEYATNAGGAWAVETARAAVPWLHGAIALAVDGGTVHMAFRHRSSELTYAQRTAPGAWALEDVDRNGSLHGDVAIAADATGRLHVFYGRERWDPDYTSDFFHATRAPADTGWTKTAILRAGNAVRYGRHFSMTRDPAGDFHVATEVWGEISQLGGTSFWVTYARIRDGALVTWAYVREPGHDCASPGVGLDGNGRAYAGCIADDGHGNSWALLYTQGCAP